MYLGHWGLGKAPFPSDLDPSRFYASATHDEALARLEFVFDGRRRLALLTGPSGSGKSQVLEVFGRALRSAGSPVVRMSLLGRTADELLWDLADAWCLAPKPNENRAALWSRLDDYFCELRYQRLSAALLLDDLGSASAADDDALSSLILRLAQADLGTEANLAIVLACPVRALGHVDWQLLERCELKIQLDAWDAIETGRYVRWSLDRAGRRNPAFDPEAIERLWALSQGIPRRIGQLADLALVAGAAEDRRTIDAETIEAVAEQLTSPRTLATLR